MRFICNSHRQQLLNNEHQVAAIWNEWMQQGSALFEQKQWSKAFRYLGCSYEAAEWLVIEQKLIGSETELNHIDRFMIAGHHLAECCSKGGREDLELHFLLSVHYRLIELAKGHHAGFWPISGNLINSVNAIKRHCNDYGEFDGYLDCLTETDTCLKKLRRCLN